MDLKSDHKRSQKHIRKPPRTLYAIDRAVDHALCSANLCFVRSLVSQPLVVQSHNMSSGQSTGRSITPAVFGQLLSAVDRYTLNLRVHILWMANRLDL